MSELAAKYKPDAATLDALARKVRAGGTGVWGTEQSMPPHPSLTLDEARSIVRLMLSVNEQTVRTLPLTGTYTPTVPPGESGAGMFLIHAAYTDNGRRGLPALTSDAIAVLRSPLIMAKDADIRQGVTLVHCLRRIRDRARGGRATRISGIQEDRSERGQETVLVDRHPNGPGRID